jgi:Cys-tRNA(Pro) deacylase
VGERWPAGVERVAAFLRATAAEARLEEFSEPTPTAEDAARAVGCTPSQIVKSLVFDCDGRTVLVLVPGDRRANVRKVARAARCDAATVASRERVLQVTGYAAGAVAPFDLRSVRRILVDRAVLAHDEVWVGAGSPRHLAALSPQELLRLTRADTADVAA